MWYALADTTQTEGSTVTSDQHEELTDALTALLDAFGEFDSLLRRADRHLWERWKAGGKAVSDEFVSMYPAAAECVEQLEPDDSEEDAEAEEVQ